MTAHDVPLKSAERKAPAGWLGRCNLDSAIPWYAALVLLFALGAAAAFISPINHDVGVGLYEANRVAGGGRMYVDLVDNNPPLWVWMTLPPVMVSRAFGWSDIELVQLCMVLVVGLSAYLTSRVLSAGQIFSSVLMRRLFVLGLVAITLGTVGIDRGQRDWIMIVLFMPYLVLAAARAMNKQVSPALAIAVGVAAVAGVALKPFFLLPWLAVEVYLVFFCRAGWPWRRAESVILVAGQAVYVALVALFTPEFFDSLKLTAKVYAAYNCPLTEFLSNMTEEMPLALLVIPLSFFVRPTQEDRHLRRILLIATIGFLAVAVIQAKGFSYHFFPARVAGDMLVVTMLASLCRDSQATNEILRPRAPALALLVLAVLAVESGSSLREAVMVFRSWDESGYSQVVALVKEACHDNSAALLSSRLPPLFPTLNYAQVRCGTRYACLWPLPGFYRNESRWKSPLYHSRAEMDPEERHLFDAVISDLLKNKPAVVMVDISPRKQAFGNLHFDYLEYFSRDDRFAAFWKDYHLLATFEKAEIYAKALPGQWMTGNPPTPSR